MTRYTIRVELFGWEVMFIFGGGFYVVSLGKVGFVRVKSGE